MMDRPHHDVVVPAKAGTSFDGCRARPDEAPAFAGATKGAAILAAALLLAGCGKVYNLRPAEGRAMPPKAATSLKAPSVDDLLAAPSQTRPERVDDLLHKSEERRDDKFDLPPPG